MCWSSEETRCGAVAQAGVEAGAKGRTEVRAMTGTHARTRPGLRLGSY